MREDFGLLGSDKEAGGERLAQRLDRWLPDKENPLKSRSSYGLFFNAPRDALSFEKRIVGFNMAEALTNSKELLAPLASYIFHAFKSHVDANRCPHICFIDETIKYIENEIMYGFIREALAEWRKKNGIFVAAVQDLDMVVNSHNGKDFLGKFATYLIWRDASGKEAPYRNELALTDSEYDWVRTPGPGREVMIKRKGAGSIIVNVDLWDCCGICQ